MKTRSLYAELTRHIEKKEHTILIGARQTGKSTLLKQIEKLLQSEGKSVVLLNLERKDILLDLNQNAENLFRYLPKAPSKKVYALIDEVQYLEDPTHFLKLLYDEHADAVKIMATGSSAFYIDHQFKDSLAGRKKVFELQTLDFEEFLIFKEEDHLLDELRALRSGMKAKSVSENQLWIALDEYLNYGGYPAIVLENNLKDKIERLAELRDSFVKRDILEAGIADENKFYRLMMILANQTGSLLNTNELANTLRLSHPVTEQYLYVLQKCFHISLIRPFFSNLRKELVKMPKQYFNDLGLRNILLNYFAPIGQRADKGALLENFVFRRLLAQYTKDQIKFWRTADGNEVDFVVQENMTTGKAIEVKFNANEANIYKYKKFTEQYPAYPLSFASWTQTDLLL